MDMRDVSAGRAAKMFDTVREQVPIEVERLRTEVLLAFPGLPEGAVRRRVLERLIGGEMQRYRVLQKVAQTSRRESRASSPLEQIKGLTSLLNEYGQVTGGNFRRM